MHACGAMVMLEFGSPEVCQLSGYWMVNAGYCSGLKLLLGLICCGSRLATSALPALPELGRFAGVAPLCWFCFAQMPCLAPSAICCAVYVWMPLAACFACANA